MQYVIQFKSEFVDFFIHNVIFNKQSNSDNQTKVTIYRNVLEFTRERSANPDLT